MAIFLTHAAESLLQGWANLFPSMVKILTWCGVLPIALSVTGSAVAYVVRGIGSVERACDFYVTDFEERRTNLGVERDPHSTSVSDGVFLSLKYLRIEFKKWKAPKAVDVEHTIIDLYASLCVLSNHVWVLVSVLSRMWKVDKKSALDIVNLFCEMSLAGISFRNTGVDAKEVAGLPLHDLHLEFCQQQAKSKNNESAWHAALLYGYLE